MTFEADFVKLLDAAKADTEASKPRGVLVRLGKGSSSGPVLLAFDRWVGDGWGTWHARADDHSTTLAEQMLPEESRGAVSWERPPRVDTVLLTLRGGINVCSVSRKDSSLDPDILSGMMEAVRNFITDSLRMQVGADIAKGGAERFEMHGHTILNVATVSATLSVILAGAAGPETEADVRRAASSLEARFGERLRAWKGLTSEVVDIRGAIQGHFFESRRYEGEWDISAVPLMQARAQDGALEAALSASRERPLALVIEGLDGADDSSLSLLSYLIKNSTGSKVLYVMTKRSGGSGGGKLDSFVDAARGALGLAEIEHPGHAGVDDILKSVPERSRPSAMALLEGWAVVGRMDAEAVMAVAGLGSADFDGALQALSARGFTIHPGERIDPYLSEMILTAGDGRRRTELYKRGVEHMRGSGSEDVVRMAELLTHLAASEGALADEASRFAEPAAKQLTGTMSFARAEEMWLSVHRLAGDRVRGLGALWSAAELEFHQNRADAAGANAAELLREACELGSMEHIWKAQWLEGRVAMHMKATDRGLPSLDAAEETARRAGDDEGVAMVLMTKGVANLRIGRFDEAISIYRTAESMFAKSGNSGMRGRALVNLGDAMTKKCDYAEAERCIGEGLAIAREIGAKTDIPTMLWHLSLLAYWKGEYARCVETAYEAFDGAKETGNWNVMIRSLTTRAAAHDQLGQFEEVEKASLEALALSERTGMGDRLAITYNMFEVKYKQQLQWFRKTLALAEAQKVARGTHEHIRKEILRPFLDELELMNRFIDSSGNLDMRRKIAARLDEMKGKMGPL